MLIHGLNSFCLICCLFTVKFIYKQTCSNNNEDNNNDNCDCENEVTSIGNFSAEESGDEADGWINNRNRFNKIQKNLNFFN